MKKNRAPSFYEILGVRQNATSEEIRRNYRTMAKKYHPDLNASKDAEEKIKLINVAYGILSDPDKRRKYDFMLQYGMTTPAQNYETSYVEFEDLMRELQQMSSEDLQEFMRAQIDLLYNQLVINLRDFAGQVQASLRNTLDQGRVRLRRFTKTFFPNLSRILFKDDKE